MPVVYKIDRADGLSYIGITNNFKKRLNQHKNSNRFRDIGISEYNILFEGEYDACEDKEREFIEQYDTYVNGLNVTPNGKGKNENCKFNTLGFKFSERSRKLMSEKSKARVRKTGYKHSEETKAHWSATRKGKVFCKRKLNYEKLIEDWKAYAPSQELLDSIPRRTNSSGVEVYVNSRPYTIESAKVLLFCKHYALKTNVTAAAVKRALKYAKQI